MAGISVDKEKLSDYIASVKSVTSGGIVEENLNVILSDAKKLHEEAGLEITKDFVEQVEAFIAQEVRENTEVFEGVAVTATHIYDQAEKIGAFKSN